MGRFKFDTLDKANARVLADLATDPQTSPHKQVEIWNKLLEAREGQDFFQTIFEELLSFGACPECSHESHWAIPEDELNQIGWVSHEKDKRVLKNTDADSCPTYQEACGKKRISI